MVVVRGKERTEISTFINATYLYLRIKMNRKAAMIQIAWVLSYVQRGVTEAWKDNLLDKLAKRELKVETTEELFMKIRNKFGEITEKKRKIEQLRTIKQGERSCNEYVQEFKKVARSNSYKERLLIKEFKRDLNRAIWKKLAEAENPLTTIGEWQERAVRLDKNQRQNRAEKRLLEKNTVCPERNA